MAAADHQHVEGDSIRHQKSPRASFYQLDLPLTKSGKMKPLVSRETD
jgi:hypothetical protein